jgi:hypothetical protein
MVSVGTALAIEAIPNAATSVAMVKVKVRILYVS